MRWVGHIAHRGERREEDSGVETGRKETTWII